MKSGGTAPSTSVARGIGDAAANLVDDALEAERRKREKRARPERGIGGPFG